MTLEVDSSISRRLPGASDASFDPAAAGWSFTPEPGFIGLVGPVWVRRDAGALRFGFQAEERHANLVGVVQGGMIMTFADRAFGIVAWEAAGGPVVTTSFECQFVGPGRIGHFIEASAEVVRATSGFIFMRGLVFSGGDAVASCQGSWKILSRQRRGREPNLPA